MKNYKIKLSLNQASVLQQAIIRYDEIGRGDVYHAVHDIAIRKFEKYNTNKNCIIAAKENFDKISRKINDNYCRKFCFSYDYERKIEKLDLLFEEVINDNISKRNKNIEIVLDNEQVSLLCFICNYICRIYFGDLGNISDTLSECYLNFLGKKPYKEDFDEFIKYRDEFNLYLDFIQMYYFNLSSGNWGVCQDDEFSYEGTFLFDCHQVLRYQLYIDNPKNKNVIYYTVDSYPALKHTPNNVSIGKKLIEIEEIKND